MGELAYVLVKASKLIVKGHVQCLCLFNTLYTVCFLRTDLRQYANYRWIRAQSLKPNFSPRMRLCQVLAKVFWCSSRKLMNNLFKSTEITPNFYSQACACAYISKHYADEDCCSFAFTFSFSLLLLLLFLSFFFIFI